MEGRALDERQRRRPPSNLGPLEGVACPDIGTDILARKLAKRELPSESPSKLARDHLELLGEGLLPHRILRGLLEGAISTFPFELRALNVRRHDGGD